MAVVYFHQPEELAPGKSTPLDDDSSNWWAGAQRCFATAAVAAVLAGSAFAAALDRNLQQQTDEVGPQSVAQAVDEYYWQNPTPPVPASLWQPLPIDFDAGEVAPGAVSTAFDDEGFGPRVISCGAQPASILAVSCVPRAVEDDAPQFAAPSFTPEEDYRVPGAQPASILAAQMFTLPLEYDAGELASSVVDEDTPPRVAIRFALDRRDATVSRLYLGDPADLGQFAGPLLARGAVTVGPAHALAASAALAHSSADSSAAAHTCAAQSAAAHSLTPGAAPAHTFGVEVVI